MTLAMARIAFKGAYLSKPRIPIYGLLGRHSAHPISVESPTERVELEYWACQGFWLESSSGMQTSMKPFNQDLAKHLTETS